MSIGNHKDILDIIIEHRLSDMDAFFCKDFIDPISQAEYTDEFPYLTFSFGDFTIDGGTDRVSQVINVFGFVKSEEDLEFKRAEMLAETNKRLKKDISFTSGSMNNVFSPFGLNAFLDKPFGGFRLTGTINFKMEQAPISTIAPPAKGFLMLSGAQFTLLDGSNFNTLERRY